MAAQRQTVNAKLAEKGVATFYEASVESRSFSFRAFGVTGADAILALQRTLISHARQYNIDRPVIWVCEMLEDVVPQKRRFGVGYRDGQTVPGWRKAEGS